MWLALALIVTLLTACAGVDRNHTSDRAGSLSTKERKALHEQAREAARLSGARYLAIERPAVERKLRQEHPTMTDADIDLLVDDALSKGLRQPPGRSPDGPLRPPPMDCTSSPAGRPVSPNCYQREVAASRRSCKLTSGERELAKDLLKEYWEKRV